jgi:hypothetical protein
LDIEANAGALPMDLFFSRSKKLKQRLPYFIISTAHTILTAVVNHSFFWGYPPIKIMQLLKVMKEMTDINI